MDLRELLRSGRPQYVTLWTVAVVWIGFALADASLFGFDPATLAILGAAFAAGTAEYRPASRCRPG